MCGKDVLLKTPVVTHPSSIRVPATTASTYAQSFAADYQVTIIIITFDVINLYDRYNVR